jgi:hypothetical protein
MLDLIKALQTKCIKLISINKINYLKIKTTFISKSHLKDQMEVPII